MGYKKISGLEDVSGDKINPATEDGNLASILAQLVAGIKVLLTDTDFATRFVLDILSRLNVDSTGRLRVGDAVITSGTITTVGTVTNAATIGSTAIGIMTAVAFAQYQSDLAFQQGFLLHIAIT